MATVEQMEAALRAVQEYGKQKDAARALGIGKRTLQRHLEAAKKNGFLFDHSSGMGFDAAKVDRYWVKNEQGSFLVVNDDQINYDQMRQDFINEAKEYAPSYLDNSKGFEGGGYLLTVDPADVHFGKRSDLDETGYHYDLQETDERFRKGIYALIQKSQIFGVDKIVFVLGNDILHVDNSRNTTTGGTHQDTHGSIYTMFQFAKRAYIAAIEELARVATVHLIHVPSNHDWESGWMLSDSICSWFRNHPNVVIKDGSMTIAHRKYIQYGLNLNMYTHGDGAKENELAQIMQYEARKAWGQIKFATCYTHHTHHKHRKTYGKNKAMIEKDHTGVTIINSHVIEPENNVFVETVRSISAPDGWHDRKGYLNGQAMECFLQHYERGPEARFTHWF